MKNSIIIRLITIALTAITLIWLKIHPPPPQFTGPVEKLTIALPVKSGREVNSIIFVAENRGHFKDQGLTVLVNDVPNTTVGLKEILEGRADIASLGDYTFAVNSFNEISPKIIGIIDKNTVVKIVGRTDRDIVKPSDLKGKKIATFLKSSAEFSLHQFLVDNYISDKDVEIVPVSSGDELISAVVSGRADAASAAFQQVYEINKALAGGTVILSTQDTYQSYNLLVAMPATLDARSQVIERFLRALVSAEDFIKAHPSKAQAIIREKFGDQSQDYLESVWPMHNFAVSLDQSLLLSLESQAKWQIRNGLTNKTKVPNYLDLIYFDALETVNPKGVTIIR